MAINIISCLVYNVFFHAFSIKRVTTLISTVILDFMLHYFLFRILLLYFLLYWPCWAFCCTLFFCWVFFCVLLLNISFNVEDLRRFLSNKPRIKLSTIGFNSHVKRWCRSNNIHICVLIWTTYREHFIFNETVIIPLPCQ